MPLLENIQYLCKQSGTSIPKLEKELGLGNGAIYKWDKSSPTADKLQKVANYFRVTLDYLLGRGDIYEVGWVIKAERDAQGMPLKELSEVTGISEFELTEYELHESPLTKEASEQIAKAFGIRFPNCLLSMIFMMNTSHLNLREM